MCMAGKCSCEFAGAESEQMTRIHAVGGGGAVQLMVWVLPCRPAKAPKRWVDPAVATTKTTTNPHRNSVSKQENHTRHRFTAPNSGASAGAAKMHTLLAILCCTHVLGFRAVDNCKQLTSCAHPKRYIV